MKNAHEELLNYRDILYKRCQEMEAGNTKLMIGFSSVFDSLLKNFNFFRTAIIGLKCFNCSEDKNSEKEGIYINLALIILRNQLDICLNLLTITEISKELFVGQLFEIGHSELVDIIISYFRDPQIGRKHGEIKKYIKKLQNKYNKEYDILENLLNFYEQILNKASHGNFSSSGCGFYNAFNLKNEQYTKEDGCLAIATNFFLNYGLFEDLLQNGFNFLKSFKNYNKNDEDIIIEKIQNYFEKSIEYMCILSNIAIREIELIFENYYIIYCKK